MIYYKCLKFSLFCNDRPYELASMYGGEKKCVQGVEWKSWGKRDDVEDIGVAETLILTLWAWNWTLK